MVKVFCMRKHLTDMGDCSSVVKGGKFSIKAVYKILSGQHTKVPWKALVCANPAPPKANFILWLVMLKRIRTMDLLYTWGVVSNTTCCLCKCGLETLYHLFFDCRFTQKVWQEILTWLSISRQILCWDQEYSWVLQTSKGKSARAQALKLFTATIYMLWLERNACVFLEKKPDVAYVIREVKYICLARCQSAETQRLLV